MNEHLFLRRQNLLKEKLGEKNLDGMHITNLTNIRYICGFTGAAASCVITENGAYFISDGRYEIQSKNQVKGLERALKSLAIL